MREWNGPPWGPKIRPVTGMVSNGGLGTPHVECNCGRTHATWWKTTPPPSCKNLFKGLRASAAS